MLRISGNCFLAFELFFAPLLESPFHGKKFKYLGTEIIIHDSLKFLEREANTLREY